MNLKRIYKQISLEHPDIDTWEATSVRMEVGEGFADQVLAAITCETTDEPWENFRAFEKVAIIINDRDIIPNIIQNLCPRELAYAAYVLKRDWPDKLFNDEVCKYIASVYDEWGFVVAPPTVSFIQPFLKLIKLTKSQASIQESYLTEIENYVKLKSGELGKGIGAFL